MAQKTFYITTPIYYVNDLPHIGHIYTTVVADTIARYKRMRGFDVRFLTGTDEHGQKMERTARQEGVPPKTLADRVVSRYHELWPQLGITNDDFIRTTDQRHHRGVHALIARLQANDDIYRDSYEGWYCAGCEAFFPETQLQDGRCPDQGHPVERVKEESYFFRLSKYQQPLLQYYAEHPEMIRPVSRYNEVVRFVEGGLRDLSISRVTLNWGVPWPDDATHVVYVWLDALTNYISALGFGSGEHSLFDTYWPADLHLVGKDILRFHCVYWPAFLLSAGIPLPKQIYGHGWWLRDEKKMSKSLGNVVRPDDLIERFGAEPLRYFLLREMNFGQDANFSDEGFLGRYNADLANGLGNTASRVLAMARRYLGGLTPSHACSENVLRSKAEDVSARYLAAMDALEFQRALETVWELITAVDGYVNENVPWSVAKIEGASSPVLHRILFNCLEALRIVAVMIAPVMPETAARLRAQLGLPGGGKAELGLAWGQLPIGQALGAEGALFPRADVEAFFAEEKQVDSIEDGKTQKLPVSKSEDEPAAAPDAGLVSIDEFAHIQLRVGQIKIAERVPKSKKLIRMEVDLGEGALRQIVAGIGGAYEPEQLVGRRAVFVANLKPAVLMGVESQGMILAASIDGKPVLLGVEGDVPVGTLVK